MKTLTTTIFILLITMFAYSADVTQNDGVIQIDITPSLTAQADGTDGYLLIFSTLDDDILFSIETTDLCFEYNYAVKNPDWVGQTIKISLYAFKRWSDENGKILKSYSSGIAKTVEITGITLPSPQGLNVK
uniref:Uncharacterized protein n=1 Tax=viral metagenome TaxID=1070528 RepID=A0A6M3J201_9ZZZZ